MRKNVGNMDESILVCAHYGPNGERLIKRGHKIAQMLNCPIYILTIEQKPFSELDPERSDYITQWQHLAKELQIPFILKDNEKRPVAKVIAEVAREKHITQIVLGQTAKSRFEHVTKGSIIDDLLREIHFIDLHIVSVARTLKSDVEGLYEKGVRAYLVKENGYYRLSFNHTQDVAYEGMFFKEIGTDFNNGIFKYVEGAEAKKVKVTDDIVKDINDLMTLK